MRTRSCWAMRLAVMVLPLALVLGHSTPSLADKADIIPDEVVKKKKKKKKKKLTADGWHKSLKAGFSFAFAQNQGVVGIPDGITIALGLQLNGKLLYRKGGHEWVSTLNIVHTESKIPNIDPFIKAADQFDLMSLYQYRFKPRIKWLGVFAGLRVVTPLLPGNYVPQEDQPLLLHYLDGTAVPDVATGQKRYRLTRSFAPLVFRQFLGALAKPLEKDWLDVDVRLGLGSREVWTRQGFVVKNDDTTPELDLVQMQDYVEGGVELQLALTGHAFGKLLSYGLNVDVMFPFANNAETDLKGAELINTEIKAVLGIKVFSWASLNYTLSVVRAPLIVDEWQVVNSLMLSITANIVK